MHYKPRTHKPNSLTLAALSAWHLTQIYIGYANAPAQLSKNPGIPCSMKPSQPISANFWPMLNNNRNTSSHNCLTYAEPSVPDSATARTANSSGKEPGRPT